MIEGVDVSYWQGRIDWPAVAAAGKRFAIIRAGDGTFMDPLFEQNIEGAHDAGLHVEIYHYLRFAYAPQDHAMILRERVELANRTLQDVRLWLDWEDTAVAAVAMTVGERNAWALELLDQLATPVGFYTGTWWWNPYMGDFFKQGAMPLWIGQYPFIGGCQTDPTAAGLAPTLPNGWNDWLIWQYTSKGRCPGIEGNVDLDVAQDSFLKEEDMDEERIKKIERGLELEREKQDIRADTELWLSTFGSDDLAHESTFRRLYKRHFRWRVEGKSWR